MAEHVCRLSTEESRDRKIALSFASLGFISRTWAAIATCQDLVSNNDKATNPGVSRKTGTWMSRKETLEHRATPPSSVNGRSGSISRGLPLSPSQRYNVLVL